MMNFQKFSSHPLIQFPDTYPVYDLSQGSPDIAQVEKHPFGIGRYNEKREGMYLADMYEGKRNIHLGIDFFAPIGTPIHSFANGEVFLFADNDLPGDYGHTLITYHRWGTLNLYALYGHLSQASLTHKRVGQTIRAGEIIAWIGDRTENGGWTPHLHFQLSRIQPQRADLPGVVSSEDHAQALLDYPDPRIVLGPIYI